jgi:hypothetical protein
MCASYSYTSSSHYYHLTNTTRIWIGQLNWRRVVWMKAWMIAPFIWCIRTYHQTFLAPTQCTSEGAHNRRIIKTSQHAPSSSGDSHHGFLPRTGHRWRGTIRADSTTRRRRKLFRCLPPCRDCDHLATHIRKGVSYYSTDRYEQTIPRRHVLKPDEAGSSCKGRAFLWQARRTLNDYDTTCRAWKSFEMFTFPCPFSSFRQFSHYIPIHPNG